MGCILALVFLSAPAPVHGQTVKYSVLPSYEELRWGDAFGFEDTRLFGGRAAFDFGPYFSLQPFYEWRDDVGIRDGFTIPDDAEVADAFDVELLGAEMQVNLGSGGLVPFLKGGGGILRTDDAVNGKLDRVFLRGGGGIRFSLGQRSGGEIFAERVSNRLDHPFIPGAVDPDELEADDNLVNSLLFGAGFRIALGGDAPGDGGGSGLLPGVFLEPYASRIDFADEMHLPRQYTIGARGGVDFNQNVGLRAYYWRAVDDEFGDWMDMEGFGGEAQFALNTGPGLSPFLLVGAGRITPFGEYIDEDSLPRSQFDHVTLGGGLSWALGDRANLELAVRDLLTTVGSDVEDVSNPDDLVSNWQYSAGISVSFGASPDRGRNRENEEVRRRNEQESQRATAEQDRQAEEIARLQEENRRLRSGEPEDTSMVARNLAELQAENRRLRAGESADTSRAAQSRDSVAARDTVRAARQTMVIPVPEVGEVILRYGEAYAPERPAVPATAAAPTEAGAREAAPTPAPPADSVQAMMSSLRALADSLRRQQDELTRAVRDEIRATTREVRAQRPAPAEEPEARVVVVPGDEAPFFDRLELGAWMPYAGFEAIDGESNNLLLGLQADLGRLSDRFPVNIIPDASFGLGGSTTLMVSVNGRYGFDLGTEYEIRPFVEGGLGISDRRVLNLNLAWGSEFTLPVGEDSMRFFIQHRGVQLFKDDQVMVGIRLNR